jgi:phenylalanyl-tRNA synthetase alpha chain
MQDTFYISQNPDWLLRTHTSSVQIREMEKGILPLRIICPGRVYRNETISARAHCFFNQVEGLYIAENVSFADLKQTLYFFVQEMFGDKVKIRFRPSIFHLPSQVLKWISVVLFAVVKVAMFVKKPDGWKY